MYMRVRLPTRRQQWDLARRTSSQWPVSSVTDSTDTDTYTDTDTSTKTKSPTSDAVSETDAASDSLPTGTGDAVVCAYYGVASVKLSVCDDDGVLQDPLGNKCV